MRERLGVWWMLAPALVVILLLFMGGLILGLLQSLNYLPIIGKTNLNLHAYRSIFADPQFRRSLILTIQIAFTSTIVATVLAIVCALVLRQRFPGRPMITFLFQLNLPIPHLVGAVAIMMLATQSGLLARLAYLFGWIRAPADFPPLLFDPRGTGVVMEYVWKETVFIGIIVLAVLQSIGTDYEELATSLGANGWQRFRYVLLPLMMPGVLSASVIVFAFVFGAFEVPLLLGATFPVPLSVVAFHAYTDVDLNARAEAMAISVVMAVIITLLTAVYMRLTRMYLRNS